jgi:sec-independent protein translocase protein TatB
MFDISWSELVLIGVVALVVIGPKELPGVLRTLGQWMRKVRGMAADFQNQFQEAMREAEMADLKQQVDDMAHDFKNFDPLSDVKKDVESMGRDVENSLQENPTQENPTQEKSTQENPNQENMTQENPTQENPTQENTTQENPTQENPTQENPTQEGPPQENLAVSGSQTEAAPTVAPANAPEAVPASSEPSQHQYPIPEASAGLHGEDVAAAATAPAAVETAKPGSGERSA